MTLSEDFHRIFLRKPLRALLGGAAVVLLTALGLLLAERWVRWAADAEVPPGRPTIGELHASLRPTTRNAAALRLEELAAELGVNVVPKGARGPRPTKERRERIEALRKGALGDFTSEIEARPDDEDLPAPAEVRAFLSEHEEDLSKLAEFLRVEGPGIVWDFDRDRLLKGPEPNLAGLLLTVRLLEVAALEADREGSPSEAAMYFEASLGLNDALARRPELLSFLIFLAVEKMHHVQVRRFRSVDETWIERLRRRQLLPALVEALRLEAVGMQGAASDMADLPFWTWPYVRLQIADTVRRKDRLAFAHERLTWRDVRKESLDALWKDPSPRWNIIGRIAWGGLEALSYRVLRRDLDRELTTLILRGRAEELPTTEVSSLAAPGRTLRLTRLAPGRFEVEALLGPEGAPEDARNLLPTRFHASRGS